jgi:hypothetical protein
MAMLGASCSPCCAACTCGASGAVDPWRPLTPINNPITNSLQVVALHHLNMYPELCCFGYSSAPDLLVNVSGGSGTTTQYLRNMSGTYVTQGYSAQSEYRLFDTRWSVSFPGTVPGFGYFDGMFQSELPSVGSDFTVYYAYPGSRRAVSGFTVQEWYYSDSQWNQIPANANDANPPPYSKTETATACGFFGQGQIVDRPGQACVDKPTTSGDGRSTELLVYITRRVATTDRLLNEGSIGLGSYFDERIAELDRSDTRVFVRLVISVRNEGACPYPQAETLSFVWEGDVTNADPCSLACSFADLAYTGFFFSPSSAFFSFWGSDMYSNMLVIPTVSVATL